MIVKGEFTLNPKTLFENSYPFNDVKSKYNFLKLSEHSIPYEHNFSLLLTKTKYSCVVACSDYPRCLEMKTIFGLRD